MNAGVANAAVLEVVAQGGVGGAFEPQTWARAAASRLTEDRGSPGSGSAARCAPATPKGHRPDPETATGANPAITWAIRLHA